MSDIFRLRLYIFFPLSIKTKKMACSASNVEGNNMYARYCGVLSRRQKKHERFLENKFFGDCVIFDCI